MPYSIEYDLAAKIISIKKAKDRDTIFPTYIVKFKVGKKIFKTWVSNTNLDDDAIRISIKIAYEQQTLAVRKQVYKSSLPGSTIKFKSEVSNEN